MVNYKKEIIIRSIKMLDIGCLTIIYFIIGYFTSFYIHKMYNDFYSNAHNNKIIIFLELCSQLFIFGILAYIIRNLVQLIPFPLNGIYGYEHNKLREFTSGGIGLGFGIFYAQQKNMQLKLSYLIDE